MRARRVRLGLVGIGLCVAAGSAGRVDGRAAADGTISKTVFVSAVDKHRAPILDLTAQDFLVKEDGSRRDVVRAEVSVVPMQVAFIVDNLGAGSASLSQGISVFRARLRNRADIAVTGWQHRIPTASASDWLDDDRGAGTALLDPPVEQPRHLLERFLDATRTFTREEARRPVIIAIASQLEDAGTVRLDDVRDSLARSGAQLYLVTIAPPLMQRGGAPSLPPDSGSLAEVMRQHLTFGDAPERSGGRTEQLLSPNGLPTVMQQLATELVNQYLVEYRTPALGHASRKLSVDVQRKGVTLRAPTRIMHEG